jgi:hypothetical protein
VALGLAMLFAIAASAALLSLSSGVSAQEASFPDRTAADTEKLSIKDVMQKAHKKPDELLKKVATGSASAQQKEELLKLYKALETTEPPKGDKEAWKERTKLLVEAATAAVKDSPDASRRLMAAANCASCHKDFK